MSRVIFFATFLMMIACTRQPDFNVKWTKVAENLQFPEGPAWDCKAHLAVSNCYGNWILDLHDGQVDTFAVVDSSKNCFRQTNGLTFDASGNLYACDFGMGAILRFNSSGECEVFAGGFEGKPFNRPNDLCFAPDGSLYFTDPHSYDARKPDGRVFRLHVQTKQVQLVADSLCFPNGIAFDASGKVLYLAESAKHRVLAYNIAEDGSLVNQRVFAHMPGGDPDGIALDRKGNVYVAHFGGGKIWVFDPAGKMLAQIPVPGKKPSNVEFAGRSLRVLYVTEDETNALYRALMPIAGLPLFKP